MSEIDEPVANYYLIKDREALDSFAKEYGVNTIAPSEYPVFAKIQVHPEGRPPYLEYLYASDAERLHEAIQKVITTASLQEAFDRW